jgi:predicted SAM-dependent methyltransferase
MTRLIRAAKNWLIQRTKEASSSADIAKYIQSGGTLRLNVGAQSNRPAGWLNVDVEPGRFNVYLDATKMTAIPDGTFDAVLLEHMIEHVSAIDGLAVMRSVHRILKPGGVARFVTPRLERLARNLIDPQHDTDLEIELLSQEFQQSPIGDRYPKFTRVDYINLMFREWGHKYLYTRDDLAEKLRSIGFASVIETRPNDVGSSLFDGAQGHGRLLGFEINDLSAFGLEATK